MPREISLDKTRNIGIMAHIDAGKTTVSERILFHTKKIHKLGETHDGAAQMDWMVQEIERGITITSAATTAYWKGHRINVIDTPGHVDFTVEVSRSLRVLDGAVTVLDAQAGVEPQTETVWRQANEFKVPRIVYVNKMDKTGANFDAAIESIIKRLGANAHPIELPIGSESNFEGIINIIDMKAYYFDGKPEENYVEIPIPEHLMDDALIRREELISAAADFDEELMMLYLEEAEIPSDLLRRAIRKATLSVDFFPVLCGSAFKNKGLKFVLDAVLDFLPSPVDVAKLVATDKHGKEIEIQPSDDAKFSALAFKVMTDPYVGKLTFFRVYSGSLSAGSYVYNSSKDQKERVGRILLMHANDRTEIKEVFAGDIAAAVGLKNTTTGDTLCDVNSNIILESMTFPEPVISVAIEPKTKADQDKMTTALQKLAEEDPTFKSSVNHETGQIIIAGMGELHLDIIADRLKREFKVECQVGKPQVAYKETIRDAVKSVGLFKRQSGGRGQYGHAVIELEPLEPGSGFIFESKIVGGVVPKEYIAPIESGIREAMQNGILAGYEMVDIKATLVDGSYHEVDSSEMAFKIAGSMAFKEGAQKAHPVLLEPIMKIEVTIPDEYMGDVMGDMNSRRGRIEGMEAKGNAQIIRGFVPLSEMFGYATDLRSKTQGRGLYTMQSDHFEEVPKSVSEEIIAKRRG